MHGRDVYKISVGNSDRKRPLMRPWRRQENIKMDLTGAGYEDMDYIILTYKKWLTLAKTARNSTFHKRWGISSPLNQPSVSHAGLYSIARC